jgi:hypothetical protein
MSAAKFDAYTEFTKYMNPAAFPDINQDIFAKYNKGQTNRFKKYYRGLLNLFNPKKREKKQAPKQSASNKQQNKKILAPNTKNSSDNDPPKGHRKQKLHKQNKAFFLNTSSSCIGQAIKTVSEKDTKCKSIGRGNIANMINDFFYSYNNADIRNKNVKFPSLTQYTTMANKKPKLRIGIKNWTDEKFKDCYTCSKKIIDVYRTGHRECFVEGGGKFPVKKTRNIEQKN